MKYTIYKYSGRNQELAEMLNRFKKPEPIKETTGGAFNLKQIDNGLPNFDDPTDEKIWYDTCHPIEDI